jgi:hypothetical protein
VELDKCDFFVIVVAGRHNSCLDSQLRFFVLRQVVVDGSLQGFVKIVVRLRGWEACDVTVEPTARAVILRIKVAAEDPRRETTQWLGLILQSNLDHPLIYNSYGWL